MNTIKPTMIMAAVFLMVSGCAKLQPTGENQATANSGQTTTQPQVQAISASPVPGVYASGQTVTLSTTTGGAILCYSLTATPICNAAKNGCATGNLYSTPVAVPGNSTLQAIACNANMVDSPLFSGTYTLGADTIAPTISSITPNDAATLVAITTQVVVTFSEAMNPATITVTSNTSCTGSILVSANNFTNCIAGTIALSAGNTVATFTPSANLSTTTTYRVRVTNAARDVAGNAVTTFTQGTGFTTDKHVITLATFATIDATPTPFGIAVDSSGNIYTSHNDHRIRKTTPGGVTTVFAGSGTATFADGTGTAASFHYPRHMAFDSTGNLYVADQVNNRIRRITPAGVVTTLAGSGNNGAADGTGTAATFHQPIALAMDISTTPNTLYVGESEGTGGLGCRIRKVISTTGVVTTMYGNSICGNTDGTGTGASFAQITGMTLVSISGVYLLVVGDNRSIRTMNIPTAGNVYTRFGSPGVNGYIDAIGTNSRFGSMWGLVDNGAGEVMVADTSNSALRTTNVAPNSLTATYAGGTAGYQDGTLSQARFAGLMGITRDSSGALYIVEAANRLRKIY